MRVLVTGARGFVGRAAVGALAAAGAEVHATSRVAGPDASGVRWHEADLLDAAARRALVDAVRPTHLLHCAWYAEHGRFWRSTENVRWLAASAELALDFAAVGGRRLVLAGTCAEYAWDGDAPRDERTTALRPATLYGAAKLALWQTVERLADVAGFDAATARIFHLYGPDEPAGRLVPSVIRACLAGEPAECSHGRQRRDLLHVDDVGRALAAIVASDATGAINVGSGEPVTLADVAERAAAAAGRPDLLRLGARPAAPGDPAVLVPAVDRLVHEVGWRPTIALDAGLRDCARWWEARCATA